MNKRQLFRLLAVLDHRNSVSYEYDDYGIIPFDTRERGGEVLSLYLSFAPPTECGNSIPPATSRDEDGDYIEIRVHGENFFDGSELERLHKKRGSDLAQIGDDGRLCLQLIGGEAFLDRRDVVLSNETSYTLDIKLQDVELADGRYLSPLYFLEESGEKTPIYIIKDGEGTRIHGRSSGIGRLVGIYVSEGADETYLANDKDVYFYIGDEMPTEYSGYYIRKSLDCPLYGVETTYGYNISDSIELVSGHLFKSTMIYKYSGEQIGYTESYGERIHLVFLEEKVNSSVMTYSFMPWYRNVKELAEAPIGTALSGNGSLLYLKYEGSKTTDEVIRDLRERDAEFLVGRSNSLSIETGKMKLSLPKGKGYIEVNINGLSNITSLHTN